MSVDKTFSKAKVTVFTSYDVRVTYKYAFYHAICQSPLFGYESFTGEIRDL